MVTFAELESWQPATLTSVADALVQRRNDLQDLHDEMDAGKPPESWQLGTSDEARAGFQKLVDDLANLMAEVLHVATGFDTAASAMKSAQEGLLGWQHMARDRGFTVAYGGREVTVTAPDAPGDGDDSIVDLILSAITPEVVADGMTEALRSAEAADAELTAALRPVIAGTFDIGDMTAAELSGLSAADQLALLESMDPGDAARILAQMPSDNAAAALAGLPAARSVAILAAMPSAKRAAAWADMAAGPRTAARQAMPIGMLDDILDELSPSQIAEIYGGDATLRSVKTELGIHAEIGWVRAEAGGYVSYAVNADGTVDATLHVEGGAGGAFDVGGIEGNVVGGQQAGISAKFASEDEFKAAIHELTSFSVGDLKDPAGALAENIEKAGGHALEVHGSLGYFVEGGIEGEVGDMVNAAAGGRADVMVRDDGQMTASYSQNVSVKVGEDHLATASASLSYGAELTTKDGEITSIKVSATGAANATLGALSETKAAGVSTSQFADLGSTKEVTATMVISPGEPGWDQAYAALKDGDIGTAAQTAYTTSRVTVQTNDVLTSSNGGGDTFTQKGMHDDKEIDIKVGEAGYNFDTTGTVADKIYIKPEGASEFHDMSGGVDK